MQSALRMQADMDATKKVRSVAKKAQDLYRHQQKIEQDVKARCFHTARHKLKPFTARVGNK